MRSSIKSLLVAVGCILAWGAEMVILAPILCALLFIDRITTKNKD